MAPEATLYPHWLLPLKSICETVFNQPILLFYAFTITWQLGAAGEKPGGSVISAITGPGYEVREGLLC